jgi:hypothetical protein
LSFDFHSILLSVRYSEDVLRARHGDSGLVREADGDRLFGHERATAREGRAKAMHCMAETFQQRSLVARVLA